MNLIRRLVLGIPPVQEPLVHFNDGPFVENPPGNPDLEVAFCIGDECHYRTVIAGGEWARANRKYFSDWRIEIRATDGSYSQVHRFDPAGKRVRVNIDSRSLGDTLAWVPQVMAFRHRHPEAEILVSAFWDELGLQSTYPELHFISPEEELDPCYAVFNIGYYFDDVESCHPHDPRTIPLGKVASDILGIDYRERRTRLPRTRCDGEFRKPYVCIATTSTAECKHWLYPGGWQTLVDWLAERGIETRVIQKEPTDLDNVVDRTGNHPIRDRIAELGRCEFFIGLGSGLSWLAWALGKPVVLVSGFSEPFAEFQQACSRIINRDVCHGCWNDVECTFDRDDWNWCPRHAGTDRQFECSRRISPDLVIRGLPDLTTGYPILKNNSTITRVLQ